MRGCQGVTVDLCCMAERDERALAAAAAGIAESSAPRSPAHRARVMRGSCRFRFQCGTGAFCWGFFGFNWDWNSSPSLN